MKESKAIAFNKAVITEEDGEFIITEYNKDDTKVYNLTNKLKEWVGTDDVSLIIKKNTDVCSEE